MPDEEMRQALGEIKGEIAARNEAAQDFRQEFRRTNSDLVERIGRGFEDVHAAIREHAADDLRQFREVRTRLDQSDGSNRERDRVSTDRLQGLKRIATWTAILGGALGALVTAYQLYPYLVPAVRAVTP